MRAHARQHEHVHHDHEYHVHRLLHRLPPVVIGIAALVWVLIRTGRKPSRVVYPCQKAALITSWAFLGAPVFAAIVAGRWKRPVAWTAVALATGWAVLALGGAALLGGGGEIGDWTPASTPQWLLRDRPFEGRVVEVHDPDATSWDYSTGYYGDYVDQDIVDAMVTAGLLELTDEHTVVGAWGRLIPEFAPGEKLAIKVNFNNASADPPDNEIDALIHPVNALVGGLLEFGFAASDITVYDVTHAYHNGEMPQRFIDGSEYPGVNFVKYVGNPSAFSDTAVIHFDPPSGSISDRPVAQVLVDADYVISMPIIKRHDYAGVTLSFKNHLGSFDDCMQVHDEVFTGGSGYDPSYNALIDIFLNRHIGGKTVLVLCDALYGNYEHLWGPPTPWPQYGNDAPSRIILGADAVATDCVCHDILYREGTIGVRADDYLELAGSLGIGVYDRETAPGVYALIDHRYLEPPFDPTGVDGPHDAAHDMLRVAGSPSGSPVLHLRLPAQFDGRASLRLYNARGQLVRTLLDGERAHGELEFAWDGADASGRRVASGVYWCRLDYEGRSETEKLLLVR
jgi:uncharacterized protein (DUF362 family)